MPSNPSHPGQGFCRFCTEEPLPICGSAVRSFSQYSGQKKTAFPGERIVGLSVERTSDRKQAKVFGDGPRQCSFSL